MYIVLKDGQKLPIPLKHQGAKNTKVIQIPLLYATQESLKQIKDI